MTDSRDIRFAKIPQKYKKAETSDLKVTLHRGESINDWELKD